MYNLIFFGPPGAGKGTQAKIISKHLNIPHLSTGDILRSKIEKKDVLATQLKEIIASGKLVSDDILNTIVAEKILNDCKDGFILDGYPRTMNQFYFIDNLLKENEMYLNFIFNINIPLSVLKDRILKRSKEENRDDDDISVVETRYKEYLNSTEIVSQHYKQNYGEIFYEIDGIDEIEEITIKIQKILKK